MDRGTVGHDSDHRGWHICRARCRVHFGACVRRGTGPHPGFGVQPTPAVGSGTRGRGGAGNTGSQLEGVVQIMVCPGGRVELKNKTNKQHRGLLAGRGRGDDLREVLDKGLDTKWQKPEAEQSEMLDGLGARDRSDVQLLVSP